MDTRFYIGSLMDTNFYNGYTLLMKQRPGFNGQSRGFSVASDKEMQPPSIQPGWLPRGWQRDVTSISSKRNAGESAKFYPPHGYFSWKNWLHIGTVPASKPLQPPLSHYNMSIPSCRLYTDHSDIWYQTLHSPDSDTQ